MPTLSILVIGDTDRWEFRAARTALEALGQVTGVAVPEAAVGALEAGGPPPDVVVIAQAYPGQFSHRDIDRLRRLSPLSPMLGLMGSWCEGEKRTGKPWPAETRIYWHQWQGPCCRELGRMSRGECSAWTLPLTASDEERLLLAADEPMGKRQGLIAIYCRAYEMEDWLSAACRDVGCSTVWLRPPRPARIEGATAALFDGSDLDGEEFEELRHLCRTLAPAPVIALLDFPRIETHRRATAAGAAGVVSKPAYLQDLFWELDRATTWRPPSPTSGGPSAGPPPT